MRPCNQSLEQVERAATFMRQLYARRMQALGDASREQLAGGLDVVEADSGVRTLGWIRNGEKDSALAARARDLGLEVTALSDYTICHSHPGALVLGFAGCASAELRRGVEVLSSALAGYKAPEPQRLQARL